MKKCYILILLLILSSCEKQEIIKNDIVVNKNKEKHIEVLENKENIVIDSSFNQESFDKDLSNMFDGIFK